MNLQSRRAWVSLRQEPGGSTWSGGGVDDNWYWTLPDSSTHSRWRPIALGHPSHSPSLLQCRVAVDCGVVVSQTTPAARCGLASRPAKRMERLCGSAGVLRTGHHLSAIGCCASSHWVHLLSLHVTSALRKGCHCSHKQRLVRGPAPCGRPGLLLRRQRRGGRLLGGEGGLRGPRRLPRRALHARGRRRRHQPLHHRTRAHQKV